MWHKFSTFASISNNCTTFASKYELDSARHCKVVQNLGGAIAGDYVSCDSLMQRYRAI